MRDEWPTPEEIDAALKEMQRAGRWSGESASVAAGRKRAQELYPVGSCARCGGKGLDRHHINGNTHDNAPGNVEILCRRCHMEIDGRLAAVLERNARPKPPKPCANCGQPAKPLRRGRCEACRQYFDRHGSERICEHTREEPRP